MRLRVNGKKGFSLVELVVVLAITAIFALIVIPVGVNYINEGKRIHNDNIARSLFLAAQNALTDMKSRGELDQLAQFSEISGNMVLTGGYLATPASTNGKLDTGLVPVPGDTENEPYLFYMMLSRTPGAPDDPMLLEFLYPYIVDKNLLEQSIVIELNATTGVVKSAFYSEVFDSFVYDGSGAPNDAARSRESTYQMGFYGVDTTGSPQPPYMPLQVKLLDEQTASTGGITNALYAEAYVPDTGVEYTLEVTDKSEATIKDAITQKDVALTFKTQGLGGVSQSSLAAALTVPYADLKPADHSGGLTSTPGQRLHTVYADTGYADPFGTGVAVYKKITWVIDYLDVGDDDSPSLVNSIGNKYAAIGSRDMKARLLETNNTARNAVSLSRHSYYSSALPDGSYILSTARHLNNVRYTGLGQQAAPVNYRQIADLNMAVVRNFAPLNWLPENGGTSFDTSSAFGGTYTAAATLFPDRGGYRISGLRMINDNVAVEGYGLFGSMEGGTVRAVCLEKMTLTSSVSSNVGSFAGRMAGGSELSQCSAYANILANGGGLAGGDINVGGLAGRLENSTVRLSYNGGYYNASGDTPDTANEILNYGYVKLGGNTQFTGSLRIGGLVGYVGGNGVVANCYNNARVNIDSVSYTDDPGEPTAYLSTQPVVTPLLHTDYSKVSLGGVAAQNDGAVSKTYATNFVAIYSDGTAVNTSNSAAIIGVNNGVESNNYAIRGNLGASVGSSSAHFMTKDQLVFANAFLGSAWTVGRGYTPVLPKADSWEPQLYPYPTLVSNPHLTPWEDIWGMEDIELAWVTVDNSLADEFDARYKGVRIETRENFYLYHTTVMKLTLIWDPAVFDIDDSRAPALGGTITSSGGMNTLVTDITNGAMYDLRFYRIPNSSDPAANTVTVVCEVPGGSTGMINYQLRVEG